MLLLLCQTALSMPESRLSRRQALRSMSDPHKHRDPLHLLRSQECGMPLPAQQKDRAQSGQVATGGTTRHQGARFAINRHTNLRHCCECLKRVKPHSAPIIAFKGT